MPQPMRTSASTWRRDSTPSAMISSPRDRPEADDRLDQRGAAGLVEPAGEGAVDLEEADRQLAQVGERRVAGAEVVDADVDAASLSERRWSRVPGVASSSAFSVHSRWRRPGSIRVRLEGPLHEGRRSGATPAPGPTR